MKFIKEVQGIYINLNRCHEYLICFVTSETDFEMQLQLVKLGQPVPIVCEVTTWWIYRPVLVKVKLVYIGIISVKIT